MPPLSVVIPLYDEARRVADGVVGVEALRTLVGPLEVIWVDDGSTDATLAALAARAEAGDIVLAEPHRGKGGALRAGVARATGDRVLLADVDWSVPPAEVRALLAVDADLVIATREGPGARRIGEPEWRHWMGRAFNTAVRLAVGVPHADTQCGCKLLRGAVAHALFDGLTLEGWAYDVELLALAHLRRHRVVEVPVEWRFEADSRVRPLRDAVAMAREVWRVRENVRAGRYGAPPAAT
jgi:glycosyltransferase involved in cell wall biosynthesis